MSRFLIVVATLVTLLAVLGASACAQQSAQAPASADAGTADDKGDEGEAQEADDGSEGDGDVPEATPTPLKQLDKLTKSVDKALAAAQSGDFVKAKSEYVKSGERWGKAEPAVKAQSAEAQTAISASMQEVQAALVTETAPNKDKVVAALQKLRQTLDQQKAKLV
jgi:hypothetical protein